ncbi:MAG: methyltransferase domain-containing protein [Bryobacteraceae bacterium]|nr:methyltransferase domain-containing protein [Bryobacteraceae bacterium]
MTWPLFLTVLLLGTVSCQNTSRLEYGKGLDVPYVQTPPNVVTAMLRMARVRANDVVIDLGCGDGRIVIAAAKDFGARGVGYDIDPQRILEARENATKAGVTARAQFVQKDLFDVRISEASVVTVFLLPPVLEKLRPRLLGDLAPGARIVSHSFPMRNWKPDQKLEIEGRTLYLFTVPKMADCTTATPAGIDQTPPCRDRR